MFLLSGIAFVVAAALVVAVVVAIKSKALPSVTASSTASGYDPADLLTSSGSKAVWRSDGSTVGTSVTVHFQSPTSINQLSLRGAGEYDRMTFGHLEFSDDSALLVVLGREDLTLRFGARTVTSVSLVVDAVARGSDAVNLAGLNFDYDGSDQEGSATHRTPSTQVTASSTAAGDPQSLVSAQIPEESVWSSAPDDAQPAIQLSWTVPREVTSVRLFGSGDAAGSIRSGLLEFSDGSAVPVAGVLPGGAVPTTVAVMPRVVHSVRFVANERNIALRAVQVGTRDSKLTPAGSKPSASLPADSSAPAVAACGEDDVPAGPSLELRLACPATGAAVDGVFTIGVSAQPGAALSATAWVTGAHAGKGSEQVVSTATADPDGRALLRVDGTTLPRGPVNLRVMEESSNVLWVQVVNASGQLDDAAGPPANGMTLAYADDFDAPLSISDTGTITTYTATKPGADGPSEFGSAIFADPSAHPQNALTTSGYLRLRTSPLPAGQTDPFGWGRIALGAMVSSATLGGGGFSAQYAYFEARVLGAPGPGTWPAFWMLSTPSITDGTLGTAEIDAFEMYGHDTQRICHSTHNHDNGKDVNPTTRCGRLPGNSDWALAWHTYGARVLPQHVIFTIDGVEVERAPRGPSADQPLYFLLNLALGGGWPIDLSSTGGTADMYVDWVRVYT